MLLNLGTKGEASETLCDLSELNVNALVYSSSILLKESLKFWSSKLNLVFIIAQPTQNLTFFFIKT
jgi:hypothetical protein